MKLRRAMSVFAVALIPLLGAAAQGCAGDESPSEQSENITQLSNYDVDMAGANAIWNPAVPFEKPADIWTALVRIGDKTIPAPTHLFGDTINIIPYSNEDGVKDAAGKVFERGDQEIAKVFAPGQVGIGLKMHRPEKRVVDLNDADPASMKEDFKLQDTHIELVVGVAKAEHGKPGAITLNNPQNYENGRFGNEVYSMIFLRPKVPAYAAAQEKEYNANTLAALVGFNAVTNFPGDYNGGDPLGAKDPEKLGIYVDQMVRAIGGDTEAQAWFTTEENQVYCAELAFIAYSAGIHTPLTKSFMEPRVGAAAWKKFTDQVKLHNKGVKEFQSTGSISEANMSNFLRLNANKRVGMVEITLPKSSLKPITALNPADAGKMAFLPMTMSDIVREFMRTHIPREKLGEQLAPVQGAVLAKMKPGLFEQMKMDDMPDTDPRKVAVSQLFDKIVEVVSTPFGSYAEFQQAIEPLMEQARSITGPRPGDETGTGLFAPPSLYHSVAQGHHNGGIMSIQYEGHGVHVKAVRAKSADEPAPEPTPVDEIANDVSCAWRATDAADDVNSCGGQAPGGCWCDSYCKTAGDCCADVAAVCGG